MTINRARRATEASEARQAWSPEDQSERLWCYAALAFVAVVLVCQGVLAMVGR